MRDVMVDNVANDDDDKGSTLGAVTLNNPQEAESQNHCQITLALTQ